MAVLKIVCAGCRDTIDFDTEMLDETFVCSNCNTPILVDAYPALVHARQERDQLRAKRRQEREQEQREQQEALRKQQEERKRQEEQRRAQEEAAQWRREQEQLAVRRRMEAEAASVKAREAEDARENAGRSALTAGGYAPEYLGLKFLASVQFVVGAITGAVGVLMLIAGLTAAADGRSGFGSGLLMVQGVFLLLAGILIGSLGTLYVALRDIAINGFLTVKYQKELLSQQRELVALGREAEKASV